MKLRFAALLFLLPMAAFGQTADEKKATVAYLRTFQTKEGGFLPSAKAKEPTLLATSSAVRALKYFGGSAANLDGVKRFVLACHDAGSGGFANAPGGKPDVVATAVGLMALAELKIPTGKYEKGAIAFLNANAKHFEEVRMSAAGLEAIGKASPKNKDWIGQLTAERNADGTYGKAPLRLFQTSSVVPAVLRLGGDVGDPKPILKAMEEGQIHDGGFDGDKASNLGTCYRVMRTYHMLKAKPKRVDDLRKFVAKCRNPDGGYGLTPEMASNIGGTYYAGIILHWLGER
jgi:prenyltransferase beta subunit